MAPSHRRLPALLLALVGTVAQPPPLHGQPFRGWNAWFAWDVSLNESHMRDAADGLVALGLRDKNFSFVNLVRPSSLAAQRNSTITTP